MIVDTSAVLSILFDETDAKRHATTIMTVSPCRMSVANFLEASIVAESRGGIMAARRLDALLEGTKIELVPVTTAHAKSARRAWQRFGKGNHRAALNFGDCFAYALADTMGEPLLFKGEDFAHTDIKTA